MVKEIKGKFPEFCEDKITDYQLLISDDLDSLMCAVVQKELFNREVKFFIDVNSSTTTQKLYKIKDSKINTKKILGLDIALEDSRFNCWDNHVVKVLDSDTVNTNSANINIALNISQSNYYSKACISSFITMLSYYSIDISKWTTDQLCVLCTIDGVYHPFLPKNIRYRATARKNLKLLEYGFLEQFIDGNLDRILELEQELNLKGKIKVGLDGLLKTTIKLDELNKIFNNKIQLPNHNFVGSCTLHKEFNSNTYSKSVSTEGKVLFNYALAGKNKSVSSYIITK